MSSDGDYDEQMEEEQRLQQETADFHKHVIYGALDGMLTTFAIVAGGAGGSLDTKKILILGISNLIADALSMGLGDALSALSHHEYVLSQDARTKRQFKESKKTEIESMTKLYAARGLEQETAQRVVGIMAKYDDFFTDIVMLEKLHLQKPEENEAPWNDGFITFCSFSIFGLLPLLTYTVLPHLLAMIAPSMRQDFLNPLFGFTLSVCITMITLFLLGIKTSEFSGKNHWRCGCEFLFMGGAVLSVAASIGHITAALLRTQYPFYFNDMPMQ